MSLIFSDPVESSRLSTSTRDVLRVVEGAHLRLRREEERDVDVEVVVVELQKGQSSGSQLKERVKEEGGAKERGGCGGELAPLLPRF